MELRDALSQIEEIRNQLAKTEVYRGLRAAPVALSGFLALLTAGIQAWCIPHPTEQLHAYLGLWIASALVSTTAAAVGITWRERALPQYGRFGAWRALEPLVPALLAGGILAAVVLVTAREVSWILPGLWQILFSLGIFASLSRLPRATMCVAVFYLLAGLFCLLHARGESALAPWAMGLPFGVGQALAAGILYWALERQDGLNEF